MIIEDHTSKSSSNFKIFTIFRQENLCLELNIHNIVIHGITQLFLFQSELYQKQIIASSLSISVQRYTAEHVSTIE